MVSLKPLAQIRNNLITRYVGRENEALAILTGLITGEPTLLVGEPGTAKTAMVDDLAKMINGKYFYYLLTRFTEPDELLGTLDILALRKGIYKRVTANRLPEAHLVFLDEIFKSSSAVRNILLDIMLNRRYLNGTGYVKLPTIAFYTASNEVSHDEEDKAFYDRLLIRDFVNYVGDDQLEELLNAGLALIGNEPEPITDVEYVKTLQNFVIARAKELPQTIKQKYMEALVLLKQKGVELSDRRKVKGLIVISAISVIYVEKEISLDTVADAIRFIAPRDEDDLSIVEEVINEAKLSSYYAEMRKLQAMMAELDNLMKMIKGKTPDELTLKDVKNIKLVYKQLISILATIPKTARFLRYLNEATSKLAEVKSFLESIGE